MIRDFTLNGKTYRTDSETVDVLLGLFPSARETQDYSAIHAVLALGLHTGRIKDVTSEKWFSFRDSPRYVNQTCVYCGYDFHPSRLEKEGCFVKCETCTKKEMTCRTEKG